MVTVPFSTQLDGEFRQRGISAKVRAKCTEIGVRSIADLIKLTDAELYQHFKVDAKCGSIDWKHIKALWAGDDNFPRNYVPPIRKQAMKNGIKGFYVDHLEKNGVDDLKDVDEKQLWDVAKIAIKKKVPQKDIANDVYDIRKSIAKTRDGPRSGGTGGNSNGGWGKLLGGLGKGKGGKGGGPQSLLGGLSGGKGGGQGTKGINPIAAAQLQMYMDEAAEMEDKAKAELDSMKPEELAKKTGEKLKQKIDNLRPEVETPQEFYDVGKGFRGMKAIDDLDRGALFDATDNYGESYESNEDLVAGVSGGLCLTGLSIDLEDNSVDLGLLPVLSKPSRVQCFGVTVPFESNVVNEVSETDAYRFIANVKSFGMTTAKTSRVTGGGSIGIGFGPFGAKKKFSYGKERQSMLAKESQSTSKTTSRVKTKSVTIIEYMMVPMRTFFIPESEMILSEDAILDLMEVRDMSSARRFLDKFGSHVPVVKRTLGGVFFRQITLLSEEELSTGKMFAAAGTQLDKIKKNSFSMDGGGTGMIKGVTFGGGNAISRKTSTSSSSGSVELNKDDKSDAKLTCTYNYSVTSLGPNATTMEDFYTVLQQNDRSWACIDSSTPHSCVIPIWRLVERQRTPIHLAGEEIKMRTNEEIAKYLKDGWLDGLDEDTKQRMGESGGSLVSAMKRKKDLEPSLEKLSTAIFESVAGLEDKDMEDLLVLQKMVHSASIIMAEPSSNANAIPHLERLDDSRGIDWIELFLALGQSIESSFDDAEKEVMERFFVMLQNNPDCELKLDAEAYQTARDLKGDDWRYFSQFFNTFLEKEWKVGFSRWDGLIPRSGIKATLTYPQRFGHKTNSAFFFAAGNFYKWDLGSHKLLQKGKFSELYPTVTAYKAIHIFPDTVQKPFVYFIGVPPYYNRWKLKEDRLSGAKILANKTHWPQLAKIGQDVDATLTFPAENMPDYAAEDRRYYWFVGEYYYTLATNDGTTEPEKKEKICDGFPGLPAGKKIDAVFVYPHDQPSKPPFYAKDIAYFFIGERYYMWDYKVRKLVSPKGYLISRKDLL
ncbi:unnamed protein product [Pseudo-nitzschia multistriata]|uniref:MACPF domain-containing protein n=1 Tax=Pseudo-nitzschia multistriata TaxID=183589 RepID=A0A448YXM0_9STRA|nr:unnamed protein product [Pseudo-nitzschia multistriata]